MKENLTEIFVIYDVYENGYYDGNLFGGILFAKKYPLREMALVDVNNILNQSFGVRYLSIQKLYSK
jgi:hypothetical protein